MTERRKLIEVVMVCLIIIGSMAGYYLGNNQGYQVGYAKGEESGYLRGHGVGYTEGNSTGYSVGYGIGYSNGTSYGYKAGYSEGNTTGYKSGLKLGNEQGYINGFSQGNSTGYVSGSSIGYSEGYSRGLASGTKWVDPTYHEMLVFLSNDLTNCLVYHDPTFVCTDFAATLSKNAYKLGWRCFSVILYFNYPSSTSGAHGINAFNTTDKGLVYVEPQDDCIMNVRIGQPYWNKSMYRVSYNDTVTKIVIFP
jgi:hypothetical protein